MTKKELVKYVASKANMTDAQAKDAFDAVLEGIRVAVVQNKESVPLIGFGTFSSKERPERQGRNPATNEKMTIPAKQVVVFKASKDGWF